MRMYETNDSNAVAKSMMNEKSIILSNSVRYEILGSDSEATYRKATEARMSVIDVFSRSGKSSSASMKNVHSEMHTRRRMISMIFQK